jgi:hypothetical protein
LTTPPAPAPRAPRSAKQQDETQLLVSSYHVPRLAPQQAPPEDTFELTPGVIVDVRHNRVYAMNPDGGIHAVDAGNGQTLWTSKLAAKPIGFAEGRVIAQVETPASNRKLVVKALDPSTGKELVTSTTDLPVDVLPSIGRTLKGDFEAFVTATDGSAVVSWEFKQPIQRTIPPGTRSELHPPQGVRPLTVPPKKVTSGGFRMDLGTGKTSQIDLKNLKELAPHVAALDLPSEQPQTNPETPFLSVDGRFGLISERTASPSDLDQYTLTVVDRQTNARLGKFKSHTSSVRFIVIDSRIIYESTPYSQRQGDQIREEPPSLNGVELATGEHVWSLILRDTTYRGPFPP